MARIARHGATSSGRRAFLILRANVRPWYSPRALFARDVSFVTVEA